MNYIYLSVVTDYTLLSSLIKIDTLIEYLKSNNINVVGILNDNLYSTMEFYTKCKKNNIKPIIGLIKNIDDKKYYIYPKNYDGLIDLFNERYVTDNLLCVVPLEHKDLYDKLEYSEKYISYKNKDELKNALLITNNVLSVNEIYAFSKVDAKYVNYLHMIDKGLTISDYSFNEYSNNTFIENTDSFDISTTNKFASLIDINISSNTKYIPKYCDNSFEYLKNLSIKGLKKRLGENITEEYKKRLLYELKAINDMGYVDYFLIVFEDVSRDRVINYCIEKYGIK